jgi:hypothetical protein
LLNPARRRVTRRDSCSAAGWSVLADYAIQLISTAGASFLLALLRRFFDWLYFHDLHASDSSHIEL